MESMSGMVAVVTGASGDGIGGAIARRFASTGATLFLSSHGDDGGVELASEIRSRGIEVVHGFHDLALPDVAASMIEEVLQTFGRVDVLVNNAGMRLLKPFGEFSAADFDELIAVNLRAPFLAGQAVVPAMRAEGGGRIINIASQLGVVSQEGFALYSASKAALISLTRSMALELVGDGIVVNAVSPGPVASGYLERRLGSDSRARSAMVSRMPIGRLGEPDEVAEVVHFLATTEGRLAQGHNVVLDGGYTLQ